MKIANFFFVMHLLFVNPFIWVLIKFQTPEKKQQFFIYLIECDKIVAHNRAFVLFKIISLFIVIVQTNDI